MTCVFFAGIAVILVPIGLGAAGLAQLFRDFHREMYIVGGLLMLVFAGFSVRGKGLAILPMPKRLMPNLDMGSAKSVFFLGMFSGAATSCCAPVLAGALTLAVISGVFWKALIVTVAYVFGMTFPLFATAYFYDRFQLDKSRFIQGRMLTWSVGTKTMYVHTTNLIAGGVFLAMGSALIALGLSGNAFWAPSMQVGVGTTLTMWSRSVLEAALLVPEFVWGSILIGILLFFFYQAKNRKSTTIKETHDDTTPCH
jgi:cytochrome c biogenesis protein CcdA